MLDDQSNRSLVRSEFFKLFCINSLASPYLMKTCAGTIEASGRRADGFQIEPVSGGINLALPTLIECNDIPDNRAEIPTPEVAQNHPHLRRIASEIPEMDDSAQILMLLGRDALRVHKVRRQINGPHNAPFAIKTDLGWLIVGGVCLGNSHKPSVLSYKTHVLDNGRTSYFPPCQSHINLRDNLSLTAEVQGIPYFYKGARRENHLGCSVFRRTRDDNKHALSVEDHLFLEIMDSEFSRDSDNSWVGPLPFRYPGPQLPNNREHALTRLCSLRCTLLKKTEMKQQFTDFMQRLFENDHAEYASPLSDDQERWYLPFFGVYHPKKPNQIRVVFDSSAQYQGLSLNSVLLTGPDLNNSLLGVLIRFRKEPVAVTADIQQMFHCFTVKENHRDYLRFLWFRDNDLDKDVIECRMKVHVFGNSPSPAVAIYGLHRVAKEGEPMHGTDTYNFVKRDFCVKDLDFGDESMPSQRSLGLNWRISTDTFTFHSPDNSKPLTRRGILSTVNSIYYIYAFAAPVTIHGRFLFRELSKGIDNWDEPLSEEKCREWEMWRNSLQDLERVHVQRTYSLKSLSKAKFTELCIFSDASVKAIGAVAYLKTVHEDGQTNVGFVLGKAKLTPPDEPTIPRLELCAAVLAVEISDFILDETDFKPDSVKRFYVYVHNCVQRIRQSSKVEQWNFVPTEHNPADCASRSVPASLLTNTMWLTGPDFLYGPLESDLTLQDTFELVSPETDSEVRPLPQVSTAATSITEKPLNPERFERFSTWNSLLRASMSKGQTCKRISWRKCHQPYCLSELAQAKKVILLSVQKSVFPGEYSALMRHVEISQNSPLIKLNPVLGEDGLIRVGGRLTHFHDQVKHQGRLFTEGALRTAGFWLINGKRSISSVIHKCIVCRKLRGNTESQKMADLPEERLSPSPPFTYVGLDVFGPFSVSARRTRGGHAESKRWAILFTCMSTRAVHIELKESLDTSSCINALRRFFAIRGPVKQFRSDCGTNFVAASKELGFSKLMKEPEMQEYLTNCSCSWEFNPPHASHMGGAWERLIGVVRRILDSMLMQYASRPLSHEVLCTFMAEISAIINARPLVPISSDPDSPLILTPAMLLTQKIGAPPSPGNFSGSDMFRQQWKQVQSLADNFWYRWRREYLPTLQSRRKWNSTQPDIQEGDLVLLKDNQSPRNKWPMALVSQVFPSTDGRVRKVQLKVTKNGSGKEVKYLRPITEVVLLLPKEN
ncbi:hypothetical protein PO909_027607 [Leuciscus waleckii]